MELTPKILADFASEAIRYRLMEPISIVTWVDSLIQEIDIPPEWMTSLSLVDQSDILAAISLLKNVPGYADLNLSLNLLNGLIFRKWSEGVISMGEVAGIGWRMAVYDNYPGIEKSSVAWGYLFDYALDELNAGYITEKEVRKTINDKLETFADYMRMLPWWV